MCMNIYIDSVNHLYCIILAMMFMCEYVVCLCTLNGYIYTHTHVAIVIYFWWNRGVFSELRLLQSILYI